MIRKLAIWGIVVLAAAWLGARWLRPADHAGFSYLEAPVERGAIESSISASGTVKAMGTVQVGAELSGRIDEILVDFNDKVARDQVVARIDPRTYAARVDQAEADVSVAEAAVAEAEQTHKKAEAQLTLRRLELKREKTMHSKGLSDDSSLDTAVANLEVAEADTGIARAQLDNRKATLVQRRANLKNARVDLDRTYIRSPVDGVVLKRDVEVGQSVTASLQTPVLFTIAQDLANMQIEASVDESDIGQVRAGQSARFTVDAYPDREFTGQVEQVRLDATEVSSVVTYTVIIDAPNADLALMPGMTANTTIILGQVADTLKVPNLALSFKPPEWSPPQAMLFSIGRPPRERREKGKAVPEVWVLNEAGSPEARPVQTGITDGQFTQLLEGSLEAGQKVIVRAERTTP